MGRDYNRTREWWAKARTGKDNDNRRKLTDKNKEEIRQLRVDGWGIRAIARMYPWVSRRTIQLVIYPERIKRVDSKKYYTKEKQREYMRRHRAHIVELANSGKIST